MAKPKTDEYADFYGTYVSCVSETDILPVLEAQIEDIRQLAERVPAERETWRYEPGKWSIREMVGHLSDAERVFGYRAWRISRGDATPLPGFEQDDYVTASNYDKTPLAELIDELLHLRGSNLAVLRNLSEEQWLQIGTASGTPISVRALAYILAGHIRHHLKILEERYGLS